jgi:hypothetical protein
MEASPRVKFTICQPPPASRCQENALEQQARSVADWFVARCPISPLSVSLLLCFCCQMMMLVLLLTDQPLGSLLQQVCAQKWDGTTVRYYSWMVLPDLVEIESLKQELMCLGALLSLLLCFLLWIVCDSNPPVVCACAFTWFHFPRCFSSKMLIFMDHDWSIEHHCYLCSVCLFKLRHAWYLCMYFAAFFSFCPNVLNMCLFNMNHATL